MKLREVKVFILVLILAFIVWEGVGYIYRASIRTSSEKSFVEVKQKESKFEIPDGRQVYSIQTNPNSPELYEAIIDPVKVGVGEKQTMTVKVRDDDHPILFVEARVETDTGINKYKLSKIEGTNDDGIWSGSWIVHDTHDAVYKTVFFAENERGENSSVALTWTDPCSPPPGGDWVLAGDCNTGVGVITGADSGNINLNGYSIIIDSNSDLVRNNSRSILIGSGSIVINSSARIFESDLYMEDSDGDGRPESLDQYISSGVGRRRRNSLITISSVDCSPGDGNTWRYLSGYNDGDGDGYHNSDTQSEVCSGLSLPSGYSDSPGTDCNDSNSSVYPKTGYFEEDGDGQNSDTQKSMCTGLVASGTQGDDCDDTNSSLYKRNGYFDLDGDGQEYVNIQWACHTSYTPVPGDDCNDSDSNIYRKTGYFEEDGDGQNSDTQKSMCTGLVASGTQGDDCDDTNSSLYKRNGYFDLDGDGQEYVNIQWACHTSYTPVPGDDCNDSDANIYEKTGYFSLDGDGWISDTQETRCTSGTAYETVGLDCDDNDGSVYPRSKYNDLDGDGHYTPTIQGWVCAGPTAPSGVSYVAGSDCYDENASVNVDQDSYLSTHRGDGSWDYNCDGTEEKSRPNTYTASIPFSCETYSFSGTPGWTSTVPGCGQTAEWRACKVYSDSICTVGGTWQITSCSIGGFGSIQGDDASPGSVSQTCR